MEECTEPLHCGANYDRETNYSMNTLRPRRFK